MPTPASARSVMAVLPHPREEGLARKRNRASDMSLARRGGIRDGSAGDRRRQQPFGGDALHRLLQLLERAHLDLADALAADVVLLRQLFERLGVIGQPPLRQDVPFAI